MKKKDKTNVMRLLDQAGVTYTSHFCEGAEGLSGDEIAKVMGEDPNQTFKTLVTVCAKTKEHFVFVVPVNKELNLKKAANSVGAKSIEMIKAKDLLPLTGYVHGGCQLRAGGEGRGCGDGVRRGRRRAYPGGRSGRAARHNLLRGALRHQQTHSADLSRRADTDRNSTIYRIIRARRRIEWKGVLGV